MRAAISWRLFKFFTLFITRNAFGIVAHDVLSLNRRGVGRCQFARRFFHSERFDRRPPRVCAKIGFASKPESESDGDDNKVSLSRGSQDDLSEETWEQLESRQPSEWMVMKEMLGINVFTYVLAAAIVFFLGANLLLGPGWLGGAVGIQGSGTFTDTSPSLPSSIDLRNPDYRL